MINPDRATQEALPLWLKVNVATLAAVQWVIFGLSWELPAGRSVLGVPLVAAGMLIGALALSGVALGAWVFAQGKLLLRCYGLLQKLRYHPLSLLLPVVCVGLALPYLMRVFWPGNTLVGIQFLQVGALLYLAAPRTWDKWDRRWLWVAPALVTLAGLGLRLWMLFVEQIWIDEGYTLGVALSVMRGRGIVPAMDYPPATIRILPMWGFGLGVYGLWAKVFGLGLVQGRVLSYLLGLPSLPLIYGTARLWYGRRTALVTTSLFSLSILFLQSTIARNNALPMTATALTLFTHVYACQRQSGGWHFVVGLLAALALEAHVTLLAFFVTYGGSYLVDYVRRVRGQDRWLRPAPLWFFLAGAVPGLLMYILVHVFLMQRPQLFFNYMELYAPVSHSLLSRRLLSMQNVVGQYWSFSRLEIVLILAAAAAALVRRTRSDQHWLCLMGFTLLGDFIVGLPSGDITYTSYGLPIYLGSMGALVTYGLQREEQPGSLWERVAYIGVVTVLLAHSLGTIRDRQQDRLAFDNMRRPVVTYIQQNFSTDTPIIGHSIFYAYMPEYEMYMTNIFRSAEHAAALTGIEPERYWQGVLVETWPEVRITLSPPHSQIQVYDSYMAARHAEEVVPDLWVVGDGELVTDAGYAQAGREATLQMVAHAQLPPVLRGGESLRLDTLWVTREGVAEDYVAILSLVDEDGTVVMQGEQELMSGWAGEPTSGWGAPEFHDVTFEVEVPQEMAEGQYGLWLEVAAPSGDGSACAPTCRLLVDNIGVARSGRDVSLSNMLGE